MALSDSIWATDAPTYVGQPYRDAEADCSLAHSILALRENCDSLAAAFRGYFRFFAAWNGMILCDVSCAQR